MNDKRWAYGPKQTTNAKDDKILEWIRFIAILSAILVGLYFLNEISRSPEPAPATPEVNETFQPGYENPAPGDDGSDDCAPGQGPVDVGPDDPFGLDGDGDGIGCE